MFSREALARHLDLFASGESSLEELRRWMEPVLLEPEVPAPPADQPLLARVAMQIEDESASDEEHRATARLLARALSTNLSAARVLKLIPLIVAAPRIQQMLRAIQTGRATRTSFLSFVSESRLPDELRRWLRTASPDSINALITTLESGAIERAAAILAGPA